MFFYILDLIVLIVFFLDNTMMWWESATLVLGYISYVCFMKFNSQIERVVKTQLNKHVSAVQVWTTDEPDKVSQSDRIPLVSVSLQVKYLVLLAAANNR